jgi:carboxyl-terminal processing protease
MDEQKNENEQVRQVEPAKPAGKLLRIKPFAFIMVLFFTVIATAGLTIFALTFGENKVVEVKVPVERAEFGKLYDAYELLKLKYYTDFDQELAVNGAINGMLESLGDPYSDYMTVEESNIFNESLSSSFQGIGAEVQERNGNIMVVSPIKNSPAERAGILPKDTILSVDDKSIKGMSVNEAVQLIRGPKGTEVKLMIQREGVEAPFEMTITRDDIPVETVYGTLDDNKIAHIQITSFSFETYKELSTILADFEKQGMRAIVLDVRQNPGGSLKTAIDISNLFIDEGKNILQVQDGKGEPTVYKAERGKKYKQPLIVLIDEGSASASEILAGALKESQNVQLVGQTTFGKGTVQEVISQKDGSTIKLTTGRWLTADGNWINEKGIAPTVDVPYPDYVTLNYVNPNTEFKVGSIDQAVNSAERMLEVLGYSPGTVDNVFDENTSDAVKKFQKQNNLEETGVLAGETTFSLLDALSAFIKENDPQLLKAKELLTPAQ